MSAATGSAEAAGHASPMAPNMAHPLEHISAGPMCSSRTADSVARAQDEGDLPGTSDPIILARALLTAQQGIVFMCRTGMDATTLAATTRSLTDHLLPEHSDARRRRAGLRGPAFSGARTHVGIDPPPLAPSHTENRSSPATPRLGSSGSSSEDHRSSPAA